MTYLDFIPLAEAKNYLRVDADFIEDDLSIERMIRSALEFIEMRTNYIFKAKDKLYFRGANGYLDIFDYPVNYTGDLVRLDYSDKVRFDVDSLQVNVGFTSVDQAPSALIECALQMVKSFYYEAEKQVNTTLLPESVMQIINSYRRFTVI